VAYEEYSYAPEDWKRLTRTVGLEGKHGEEERTYVSIFDQADESHEYELKLSPGHGYKHGKCHPPKDRIGLELKREFIGGPGTDDLVASKYRGHGVGLLKDALGSTIALTNHGGNPIARVNYDAWGVIEAKEKDPDHHKKPCGDDDEDDYLDRFFGGRGLGQINPWRFGAHFGLKVNPYLFTGRRYESLTGQYWHRNRFYNPRHGRFITKDPIGFNGGNNLWWYANNNPVRWWDAFGLTIEGAITELEAAYGITGAYGAIYKAWADELGPYAPPTNEEGLTEVSRIVRGIYNNAAIVQDLCLEGYLRRAIREIMCGQDHHAISRRIYDQGILRCPNLVGRYRARDGRFVAKGIEGAHIGYETWHRNIDQEVIDYLQDRPNITPEAFEKYLSDLYRNDDRLRIRFPFGFARDF
jgi:RHS repeat-associated protein